MTEVELTKSVAARRSSTPYGTRFLVETMTADEPSELVRTTDWRPEPFGTSRLALIFRDLCDWPARC